MILALLIEKKFGLSKLIGTTEKLFNNTRDLIAQKEEEIARESEKEEGNPITDISPEFRQSIHDFADLTAFQKSFGLQRWQLLQDLDATKESLAQEWNRRVKKALDGHPSASLTDEQLEHFVTKGYLKIPAAVKREQMDEALRLLK